ncbi:MAG: ribosome biogenesis GTPase [Planctomycetota bacterium]
MTNQKRKDHQETIKRHLDFEESKTRKQRSKQRKTEIEGRGPRENDWKQYVDADDDELPEQLQRMKSQRDVASIATPRAGATDSSGGKESSAVSDAADAKGDTAGDAIPIGELALVVGLSSGRALLWQHKQEFEGQLHQSIATSQQTSISVGDYVHIQQRDNALPIVARVAPRRTRLSRQDPADARRERVIAANIDIAVVVLAARQPRLRARLIDRYRLAIEHGGAEALICITKMDLLEDEDGRAEIEELLDTHRRQGLQCLTTSAEDGEGLEQLSAALLDKTVVFVGQSGTGKSSLVNALDADPAAEDRGLLDEARTSPESSLSEAPFVSAESGEPQPATDPGEVANAADDTVSGLQEVGRVRSGDGKGRHTTTSSSLIELACGLRLIDTPGIRGFGLWGIGLEELKGAFPDVARCAQSCRYNDCSHMVEPGCAVRAAVESGELEESRFDAYSRLHQSLNAGEA